MPGEEHEATSVGGMTALLLEADGLMITRDHPGSHNARFGPLRKCLLSRLFDSPRFPVAGTRSTVVLLSRGAPTRQ
jgi:hypothetical protein